MEASSTPTDSTAESSNIEQPVSDLKSTSEDVGSGLTSSRTYSEPYISRSSSDEITVSGQSVPANEQVDPLDQAEAVAAIEHVDSLAPPPPAPTVEPPLLELNGVPTPKEIAKKTDGSAPTKKKAKKKESEKSKSSQTITINPGPQTGAVPGSDKASFVCDVCLKQFVTKGSLKTHGMVHSGERPFACPLCSKAFSQQANCARHIRLMHPDAHSVIPVKTAPEIRKAGEKGADGRGKKKKKKQEAAAKANKAASTTTNAPAASAPSMIEVGASMPFAQPVGPPGAMYMYQHPYASTGGPGSSYGAPPGIAARMHNLVHRTSSNDSFLSLDLGGMGGMGGMGPIGANPAMSGLLSPPAPMGPPPQPPPPPPGGKSGSGLGAASQRDKSKKRKKEDEPVAAAKVEIANAGLDNGKKGKEGAKKARKSKADASAQPQQPSMYEYNAQQQQQHAYPYSGYLPPGATGTYDWKGQQMMGSPNVSAGNGATGSSFQAPPPMSLEWNRAKSPPLYGGANAAPAATSGAGGSASATGAGGDWMMRSKSPPAPYPDMPTMFHHDPQQQQYYFYPGSTADGAQQYQLGSPNSQRAAAFAHQQAAAAAAHAKYYPQQQQGGAPVDPQYLAYSGFYPQAAAGAAQYPYHAQQMMNTGAFAGGEGAEGYSYMEMAPQHSLDLAFDPNLPTTM